MRADALEDPKPRAGFQDQLLQLEGGEVVSADPGEELGLVDGDVGERQGFERGAVEVAEHGVEDVGGHGALVFGAGDRQSFEVGCFVQDGAEAGGFVAGVVVGEADGEVL